MVDKCLHCHLVTALEDWLEAAEKKGTKPGRVQIAQYAVTFLCDAIEAMSEPGSDRISAANSTAISFQMMMSARVNAPADEKGAPTGASKH